MHSVESCDSIPYPTADICSTRATLRRTHSPDRGRSVNAMRGNALKRQEHAVDPSDERHRHGSERAPE